MPVEVYSDKNCSVRVVRICCYSLHGFWAVFEAFGFVEVKENAEYYTAGPIASKVYMGELAPFAPEILI